MLFAFDNCSNSVNTTLINMSLFEKTMSGFDNYFKQKANLSEDYFDKGIKSYSEFTNESVALSGTKSPLIIEFNEDDLERYFSPSPLRFKDITIGTHPDFEQLKHDETDQHYAVALFMDIKG